MKKENKRLFIKIKRENLPSFKDRYPFIYLERGRLEIDDSSVKWIDSEGSLVRLPVATLNSILLGPGTSVTHEAIKVIAASNCMLNWVGEDSMLFYAAGQTPTSDTKNLRFQINLASNKKKRLEVARRMFVYRFPNDDVNGKTLQQLMGMEGKRVKALYQKKADEYQVGWKGRSYVPGNFELGDITNKMLTSLNAALYGILTSAICSMGYSPRVGFIHSGCPLPFVYDMADLYKDSLCIDLAFKLTRDFGGVYNRQSIAAEFRKRVMEQKILERIGKDLIWILRSSSGSSSGK